MIYSYTVTTPANTPATSKVRTALKIAMGVIHQIDVIFPPGPAGLLYVAINHGGHQVWPSNPSEFFHTDDDVISFREHYEVYTKPTELVAYSYNLDDTYSHDVIIRIGLLPRKFILRRLF